MGLIWLFTNLTWHTVLMYIYIYIYDIYIYDSVVFRKGKRWRNETKMFMCFLLRGYRVRFRNSLCPCSPSDFSDSFTSADFAFISALLRSPYSSQEEVFPQAVFPSAPTAAWLKRTSKKECCETIFRYEVGKKNSIFWYWPEFLWDFNLNASHRLCYMCESASFCACSSV